MLTSVIICNLGRTSALFCDSIDGLAWDWISEKMYWTDECYNHIRVLDPLTGNELTLTTNTGSNTRGIVVDPSTR